MSSAGSHHGSDSEGSEMALIHKTRQRSEKQPGEESPVPGERNSGTGDRNPGAVVVGFHNQNCFIFLLQIILADIKRYSSNVTEWFTKVGREDGDDEEEWLESLKGYVGTIAGLIMTMSFAAAIAPPGGVVGVALGDSVEDVRSSIEDTISQRGDIPMPAGEAIAAVTYPAQYSSFLFWNNACIYVSLMIFVVMISGIRLKSRFVVWLCSLLISGELALLANLFTVILSMTTPRVDGLWKKETDTRMYFKYAWFGMVGFVVVLLTARFAYWSIKKLSKRTITIVVPAPALADVVGSAVGFAVFTTIMCSWSLTFAIGGERLFGPVWDELVMYNLADRLGLLSWD